REKATLAATLGTRGEKDKGKQQRCLSCIKEGDGRTPGQPEEPEVTNHGQKNCNQTLERKGLPPEAPSSSLAFASNGQSSFCEAAGTEKEQPCCWKLTESNIHERKNATSRLVPQIMPIMKKMRKPQERGKCDLASPGSAQGRQDSRRRNQMERSLDHIFPHKTSSSIFSSSLVSTVGVSSSSLTMSENFQYPSLLGTPSSLQLSLPMVSHAASSLTGSVCNFSRVSAPNASLTWLLPSASGTSFQPLMGSTEKKSSSLGDFTVTVTEQNTAMSMATQYGNTSDANNMVPLYPSLSASLVQGTPSHIPNQGHSLSLLYQQGSQVGYYNQGTLRPLLSGELGPCLQSYGSGSSYMGSRASAPQPEMVMVLKEVQPADTLPPGSTSGTYYSAPAQTITQPHFQVMENSLRMETSLGLQPPSQKFCLLQTQEFPKTCNSRNIHTRESNQPPEVGGISVIPSVRSSSKPLALPPAKNEEQTESNHLDDIKINLSKPLDVSQIPTENQHEALLPLQIPDIHQLRACIDPVGQEKQPGSENTHLGKNSLSLEDQGTLGNETETSGRFANIAALVEESHLPQLFRSWKDRDQSKGPKVIKTKDARAVELNQVRERSRTEKGSPGQARKNKYKAFEPLSAAPRPKSSQRTRRVCYGAMLSICGVADGDKAPVNTAKHSNRQSLKAASGRTSKTRSREQEKAKRTRKSNSKKAEEAMHMLESVQVFHALGKKTDKETGFSSSQTLRNSRNPKDPRPPTATKMWPNTPQEGKGLEKPHAEAQKPDASVRKQCPSPSLDERPPPGKVKLVPLPFLTEDKPQARRVPRRPQSLASHRPALASSTRPGSTDAAQPTAVNSSQQAPAHLTDAACSSLGPVTTNSTQPDLTNSTQPSVTQSAASRPVPYRTSSGTSLQQEPIPTAVPQHQPPPKPQTQLPAQEFCFQPHPWRKADISGPVVSKPITEEQRPEREAMKRWAQQERENAAKYTTLGKVQAFIEREKEMEMADYYGYV
ncbi:hypothetical protein MC885_008667, partial [Smutsia gigantea]